MQPFMNPQYFNQYTQYRQPYQPYQQYQPIQPQPQVGGKVVDSIDVVRATDIPMDGNLYYFPKADGTEIYVKSWNVDGTTRISTYKPFVDTENTVTKEQSKINVIEEITSRFDNRFDKIERLLSKATTSRVKKDGETE